MKIALTKISANVTNESRLILIICIMGNKLTVFPKTVPRRKKRKNKNKKATLELFVLHTDAIAFWNQKIYTNEPFNEKLGKIIFHHCKDFNNLKSHE